MIGKVERPILGPPVHQMMRAVSNLARTFPQQLARRPSRRPAIPVQLRGRIMALQSLWEWLVPLSLSESSRPWSHSSSVAELKTEAVITALKYRSAVNGGHKGTTLSLISGLAANTTICPGKWNENKHPASHRSRTKQRTQTICHVAATSSSTRQIRATPSSVHPLRHPASKALWGDRRKSARRDYAISTPHDGISSTPTWKTPCQRIQTTK
jgi:hypothetical protein